MEKRLLTSWEKKEETAKCKMATIIKQLSNMYKFSILGMRFVVEMNSGVMGEWYMAECYVDTAKIRFQTGVEGYIQLSILRNEPNSCIHLTVLSQGNIVGCPLPVKDYVPCSNMRNRYKMQFKTVNDLNCAEILKELKESPKDKNVGAMLMGKGL